MTDKCVFSPFLNRNCWMKRPSKGRRNNFKFALLFVLALISTYRFCRLFFVSVNINELGHLDGLCTFPGDFLINRVTSCSTKDNLLLETEKFVVAHSSPYSALLRRKQLFLKCWCAICFRHLIFFPLARLLSLVNSRWGISHCNLNMCGQFKTSSRIGHNNPSTLI